MDLNNSIKTILLSIKIFEEHKKYIEYLHKGNNINDNKSDFISNFFQKKILCLYLRIIILKKE